MPPQPPLWTAQHDRQFASRYIFTVSPSLLGAKVLPASRRVDRGMPDTADHVPGTRSEVAGLAVPAARPDRIGAPLDLRRRLDRPALGQAEQDRKLLRRRHAEVEPFLGRGRWPWLAAGAAPQIRNRRAIQ